MFSSMHNEISGMLASLQEQQERLAETAKEMRAVTASATTGDHMVRATVDSRGRITELAFKGNRWRDMAPKELATKVVDVVTRAQDKAAKAVTGLAAGITPSGLDLQEFIDNGPDFGAMLADIKGGSDDE